MLLASFSVLSGIVYPLLITGIAQLVFPSQANGSLIVQQGKVVGSHWIGQPFQSQGYFWSRPSVTAPHSYNASASSGSNQGSSNPALKTAVITRIQALHEADPSNQAPVPIDLVTASASGLDPHITPAAAYYQLPRVARSRRISEAQLRALINSHIERPTWGLLGESRVNVLSLNRALDVYANSTR